MLDAISGCSASAGPRNCDAGLERRRELLLLLLLPSSGAPIVPLAAAAIAATLLAAVELMLFLRVTRCAGFMVPVESECGRDLGSEPATLPE
jgi:hypothetical protein